MRFFIFLFLFIPLFSFAGKESSTPLELSSDNAGYDGEELKLDGQIHFSHPLGKLTAKNASLKRETNPSNNKIFSSVLLENRVKLELQNGAVLSGEKAFYNLDTHELEFIKLKNRIRYRDKIKQNNETYLPYTILSNKAKSSATSNLKDENLFFKFSDNVNIKFEKGMLIHGDEALFQKEKITLFPKNPNSSCRVKSKDLKIVSGVMELNLREELLTLEKPLGLLWGSTKFSANSLTYNEPLKKITLEKEALLRNNQLLLTAPFIDVFLKEEQFKKVISSPDAKITLKNERHSKISSSSPITFDFEKHEITSGDEESKSCICYEDDLLMILAKKGKLFLSSSTDPYNIESATLENDIYFISTEGKGKHSYGVAEKLTFSPDKNLFILEGLPGKKVLLSKSDNSLTLSADKIEISHAKKNNENSIKGFGTVRFILNQSEKSKIQETINKYKQRYGPKK
jgi:hypothetical protein